MTSKWRSRHPIQGPDVLKRQAGNQLTGSVSSQARSKSCRCWGRTRAVHSGRLITTTPSRRRRSRKNRCHVAGNCKNASVHALCCSLFENHFGKNYRICCNNDNAADRWDAEYGRVEFTEALGLSPTVRLDIIGKGKGHFGSLDSRHVMHFEYQIRCSKRVEIIKLDTRYQIKRTAKSLEFMKPDSCILIQRDTARSTRSRHAGSSGCAAS
jgi:hypothetical protein